MLLGFPQRGAISFIGVDSLASITVLARMTLIGDRHAPAEVTNAIGLVLSLRAFTKMENSRWIFQAAPITCLRL
jgi:hypothetical protein